MEIKTQIVKKVTDLSYIDTFSFMICSSGMNNRAKTF